MSDIARGWIAPAWMNREGTEDTVRKLAYVVLFNPGPATAQVTVRFFSGVGALTAEDTRTIPPMHHSKFENQGFISASGWLRITSDNPVAPWGETPGWDGTDYVNMIFYREAVPMGEAIREAMRDGLDRLLRRISGREP